MGKTELHYLTNHLSKVMSKCTLLLFIQSPNPDTYLNILTHCVNNENVGDVYFGINEGDSSALSDAKDVIRKIREKFENLLNSSSSLYVDSQDFSLEYRKAYEMVPQLSQVENRIIRIIYAKPELSTQAVKKLFPTRQSLLVDISGCSKKVSTDIIASYMSSGIENIRCFELDKQVVERKMGKLYHNIRVGLPYYEYVDFSKPGTTTIKSFNRMRSQGYQIKALFVITLLLGIVVVILIHQNKNVLAQYASIILAAVTGLGLINDSFGLFKLLKHER